MPPAKTQCRARKCVADLCLASFHIKHCQKGPVLFLSTSELINNLDMLRFVVFQNDMKHYYLWVAFINKTIDNKLSWSWYCPGSQTGRRANGYVWAWLRRFCCIIQNSTNDLLQFNGQYLHLEEAGMNLNYNQKEEQLTSLHMEKPATTNYEQND